MTDDQIYVAMVDRLRRIDRADLTSGPLLESAARWADTQPGLAVLYRAVAELFDDLTRAEIDAFIASTDGDGPAPDPARHLADNHPTVPLAARALNPAICRGVIDAIDDDNSAAFVWIRDLLCALP